MSNQGGLNKKEIQLNFHKMFSILIFNELHLFLVTLNRIKLGRAVMNCLASVVSLIFLPETLIWNNFNFGYRIY